MAAKAHLHQATQPCQLGSRPESAASLTSVDVAQPGDAHRLARRIRGRNLGVVKVQMHLDFVLGDSVDDPNGGRRHICRVCAYRKEAGGWVTIERTFLPPTSTMLPSHSVFSLERTPLLLLTGATCRPSDDFICADKGCKARWAGLAAALLGLVLVLAALTPRAGVAACRGVRARRTRLAAVARHTRAFAAKLACRLSRLVLVSAD